MRRSRGGQKQAQPTSVEGRKWTVVQGWETHIAKGRRSQHNNLMMKSSIPVLAIWLVCFVGACSDGSRPAAEPVSQPHTEPLAVLEVGDTTWNVELSKIALSSSDKARAKSGSTVTEVEEFAVHLRSDLDSDQNTRLDISRQAQASRPYETALVDSKFSDSKIRLGNATLYKKSASGSYLVYDTRDPLRHFDFVTCQPDRLITRSGQDLGYPCRGFIQLGQQSLAVAHFQAANLDADIVERRFKIASSYISQHLLPDRVNP